MFTVSPAHVELWNLRVLLHHVRATGWRDIKTHEGVVYSTFAAAAVARGLAKDDAEQYKSLEEAELISTPREIRFIFAVLLRFQTPTDPGKLWERFKMSMAEDFIHADHDEDVAVKMVCPVFGIMFSRCA
jgi:hypothetical protein